MDTASQYGQKDFTLPHDVVKLPSGGIFYKNKKKAIKIGYLTASDENLLLAGDNAPKEGIVLNLLRSKIYEPDLRPEELLDGDVEAILLFLRNTAFGPEYKVTVTDPQTGVPFVTSVFLDELNYKKTEHQPDENGLFQVELPVSKAKVALKILTLSERIEIDKIIKSYPSERVAPSVTTKLAKQIHSIEGDIDRNKIDLLAKTANVDIYELANKLK